MLKEELSPADSAVDYSHSEQGEGKVPAVAHGDEHHIAVVLQVPLCHPTGWVKHKGNLREPQKRLRWSHNATEYKKPLQMCYIHIYIHMDTLSQNTQYTAHPHPHKYTLDTRPMHKHRHTWARTHSCWALLVKLIIFVDLGENTLCLIS